MIHLLLIHYEIISFINNILPFENDISLPLGYCNIYISSFFKYCLLFLNINFTLISLVSLNLYLKSNLILFPSIYNSIFSSNNFLFISFASKYNFLYSSYHSFTS